jgi:trafficking protein particle complex subunit 8
MYFLRKAQEMYRMRPQKELSPSFWDSEGVSASVSDGFDAILSGIEHPLGRLLYTTSDVASAVKIFVGLLRGSPGAPLVSPLPVIDEKGHPELVTPSVDKVFLDDFRVALSVGPR